MPTYQTGDEITLYLTDMASGLVGTVTVELRPVAGGSPLLAATTAGITEDTGGADPSDSTYTAVLTLPEDGAPGDYFPAWDPHDGGAVIEGHEDTFTLSAHPGAAELRPALTEVGALLRARTRDDQTGSESGTFSVHTRPTADEVADFIDQAQDDVELRLPADTSVLSTRQASYARRLIALGAAMFVEVSLQPDATTDSDSAYARLKEMYDARHAALMDSLEDDGTGGPSARFAQVPLTTATAAASADWWPLLVDELLP